MWKTQFSHFSCSRECWWQFKWLAANAGILRSGVFMGMDELIVERPLDISWAVNDRPTQTLQLLNYEDEMDISEHCEVI
jgi:hypothetical protein